MKVSPETMRFFVDNLREGYVERRAQEDWDWLSYPQQLLLRNANPIGEFTFPIKNRRKVNRMIRRGLVEHQRTYWQGTEQYGVAKLTDRGRAALEKAARR